MLIEIEDQTGITPKALLNAPNLHGSAKEVANAYRIMAKGRSAGFAANPIPLSEIVAFTQLFGPPSVPIDVLVTLVEKMDDKYLELVNKDGNKPAS